ncbi:diaminohydroxyphosphoribosylamino-pyrimidine deaminase [Pholiota conissans]|uniref:Diaminohydroxyphosphoribosylamino-pyrimidine deaminase n=1 Tax=Pholiota conissans TaxID=109636 RepID=A0A9P5ZAS7_9AGAR|nr:diaminohydroxyphosphoribosylamino-pyrimidine deaminase [Pholiota conissans]
MEQDLGDHIRFLYLAIGEANKCTPIPTAFCVGCVLVVRLPDSPPTILASGYSRELAGNTHAEANALCKARKLTTDQLASLFPLNAAVNLNDLMAFTDVYTTLEPCSVRTSGLAPCADALIEAKVKRCFIGAGEPDDFVQCIGAQKLKDAGIEVVWLKGLEAECLCIARKGRESEG